MKSEIIGIAKEKIIGSVLLAFMGTFFQQVTDFMLIYSPFYGILGVIGNVVSWAIYQMAAEKKGEEVKKKSNMYHIATFTIAFIVPIMFTTALSEYINLEKMLCAFLIGLCTSFMDEALSLLKKIALSGLKSKINE